VTDVSVNPILLVSPLREEASAPREGDSPRLSARAVALAVTGATTLLLAYVLPLRGSIGGQSYSILLGPRFPGQTTPLRLVVFSAIRPVGVLSLLVLSTFVPAGGSLRFFRAGVITTVGLVEGLYFIGLLGTGAFLSATAWVGLVGALVTLTGGVAAFSRGPNKRHTSP